MEESMRRPLLLLTAISLLSGCASGDNARSWVGQKVDDLIYSWGPPAAVHELSDGRQSLTFSHHRLIGGNSLYCNVIFSADGQSVIRTVDIDGNIGGCNRLLGSKPAAPQ